MSSPWQDPHLNEAEVILMSEIKLLDARFIETDEAKFANINNFAIA
jgi:hypothetical protein